PGARQTGKSNENVLGSPPPWFNRVVSGAAPEAADRQQNSQEPTMTHRLVAIALFIGGVAVVPLASAGNPPPPGQGPVPRRGLGRRPAAEAKFNDQPTADQVAFFEKKIRPVLVDQCGKCHSATAEKLKGGLLLDTRDGLRKGGDSGPAVVPGNPDRSTLIK